MSGMSAISATILCTHNKDFDEATADTMVGNSTSTTEGHRDWFFVWEPQVISLKALRSETYGFRLAALVFSLPRALCLWSLGLLITQTMFLTFRLLNLHLAIGVATIVLLVLLGTGRIVSPQDYGRFCRILANWSALLRAYGQILLRRRRWNRLEQPRALRCMLTVPCCITNHLLLKECQFYKEKDEKGVQTTVRVCRGTISQPILRLIL